MNAGKIPLLHANRLHLAAITIFCLIGGIAHPEPANAQKSDLATARDDPGGVRMGRLYMTPALSISERYDDNLFLAEDAPVTDLVTTIAPRLTLQGDWQRFRLHLSSGAEIGFYADSDDDNYQDFDLSASGRLDLGNASLNSVIAWNHKHDPRGGNDVPSGAREPVIYRDVTGTLGATYASDLFHYESELTVRRLAFDDSQTTNGAMIRNDDRDRTELRETLRTLMPIDPGREAYGEVSFNQRQYDRIPDDTGRVRDSSGFRLLGGLKLDLTDLITADLAAGWMSQTYADPSFGDIADYTLRADTTWALTRLTDIRFSAARTVRETTVTGASGILAFDIGAGVSHELRRGFEVSTMANYSSEEFRQTNRRDQTRNLGLSLSYLLNRFARIEGAIDFDQRVSNSDGNDYERLQTNISLKLEM